MQLSFRGFIPLYGDRRFDVEEVVVTLSPSLSKQLIDCYTLMQQHDRINYVVLLLEKQEYFLRTRQPHPHLPDQVAIIVTRDRLVLDIADRYNCMQRHHNTPLRELIAQLQQEV